MKNGRKGFGKSGTYQVQGETVPAELDGGV